MKEKLKYISLELLDDNEKEFDDDFAWTEIVQVANDRKKQALLKQKAEQVKAKQIELAKNLKPTKVFRSRPSFRELLRAYNGRSQALSPIMQAMPNNTQSSPVFKQQESLECISIPTIPGKILRPKN